MATNYATVADLLERYESAEALAHLTDTADTTGTYSATRVQEALDYAAAFQDSFIAKRYKVPVIVSGDAGLAAIFKGQTCDLAVYFLGARPGCEAGPQMQERYDRIVEWLQRVASGEIEIPGATTPPTTATRDPLIAYGTAGTDDSSQRVFSRRTQEAV